MELNLVELAKTLAVLILIAAGQTVALEQIFDTPLYQRWLGWGVDGQPSKILKSFDLRPWISVGVDIYTCHLWGLQFPGQGLNGYEVTGETTWVGILFAGFLIGGGTKRIKKMMKDAADTAKEVK